MIRSTTIFAALAALAAMAASAPARASGTCGQSVAFDFSGVEPLPFGGEYIGIFTNEGQVIDGSVDIEFTTAGAFDAANIGISFQLIDATHSVGYGFSGASVGWSGQGTFTHVASTANFNGLLFNQGNPWGGMLLEFTNLDPGSGPIQGSMNRAIYTLEFGPCPIGDTNKDLSVNVDDLLLVINAWGPCPARPAPCDADTNSDSMVNVDDLLAVINHWHAWCPNCK